ncbi:PAS domain S-box protein, partial [Nitrospirota bacterium]
MNTEKSKMTYKVIIALTFGFLGFYANFYPLNVLIPPNKASFVWGLVFPMLISLSWGWRWGLFSATLGLGAQTMWILWLPKNGWAPFVAIPFYTFWIMWHGWCNEHRKKGFLSTIYSAEIPFRIMYAIVLATVFSWSFKFNPSPWAPQMTMTTAPPAFVNFLQFKVIFEGFIVLLLADVLRNVSIVKKILLIEDRGDSKSDFIISGALLFGLVFWIISGITHTIYSPDKSTLADNLILNISPENAFERLIVVCMCLVAGLIISNYFSKYRESEEKYRTLFNSNQVGVSIVGTDGDILDVNSAFCEMLGYSSDELKLKSFKNISHPDELDENRKNFIEMVDGKRKSYFMDKKYIHKQGHIVWGNLSVFGIFNRDGNFTYGFAIIRDISTKKEYEVTINNSLKEKEVLLKEVHHRVKNNMAVMSSLLSLQSGYVEDKKALSLFKESQ